MCNIFCLDAFYSCFLTSKLHENNVDRNSGFMSPSALTLAKMKLKKKIFRSRAGVRQISKNRSVLKKILGILNGF